MNRRPRTPLAFLICLGMAAACEGKDMDETTAAGTESEAGTETGETGETSPGSDSTTGETDASGTETTGTGSSGTSETEGTSTTSDSDATGDSESSTDSSTSETTESGSDTDATTTESGSDTDATTGVADCDAIVDPIAALDVAFAIRDGDIPDDSSSGSGSSTSTGDEPDPDTLRFRLSNHDHHSCADPSNWGECGGEFLWTVSFSLPPELQAPGVYALEDINGFESVMGPNDPGPDCWGGGGTLWSGYLVVESIDDAEVKGKLCSVDPIDDYDPNGTFTAPRC